MNNKLNKARQVKDDEFYTLKDDVISLFNDLKIDLNQYIIDLPFDSEQSNFYIVSKQKGFKTNMDSKFDYKNFKYSKNGIVVSNPPFSIFREIIDFFIDKKIKFLLISPLLSVTYKNVLDYFKKGLINYSYHSNINNFIKPDGSLKAVNCCVISNLNKDEFNYKFFVPKSDDLFLKTQIEPQLYFDFDNQQIRERENIIMDKSGIKELYNDIYYTTSYLFHKDAQNYAPTEVILYDFENNSFFLERYYLQKHH